jgi:hypothetical protein
MTMYAQQFVFEVTRVQGRITVQVYNWPDGVTMAIYDATFGLYK